MSTDSPSKVDRSNDGLDGDSANNDQATGELNGAIDELLNQLSTKFSTVTEEILKKMDQMSERLDNLEAALHGGHGDEA